MTSDFASFSGWAPAGPCPRWRALKLDVGDVDVRAIAEDPQDPARDGGH